MRLLFLNQYFPPDAAPTGVLLRELAERLMAEGHEAGFVDAAQNYRAGQGSGGRMRRELMALMHKIWTGLAKPRPDVIVSASSPPCLAFIGALLAVQHRALHVHWVMDLYPEIAVSLGEVTRGLSPTIIKNLMGWSYRQTKCGRAG